MSHRRKIARASRTGVDELAADPRAELLRRFLLAFITALIVARPFVLGEDPGLLIPFSGIANQLFALLWLLAALGWAAWRLWSRQDARAWSAVELAFAALVIIIFCSAYFSAHYRHPAMLIAWEWLVLLLAFALVRRLTRTPAENQGLLAALLATGVSLGAYSFYQYAVELPRDRAAFADPEVLRKELKKQLDIDLPAGDPHMEVWRERVQQNNTFATYAHPNSFAGFLALLLPGSFGLALFSIRRDGRSLWSALAWMCVVTMALGLWFTHSRGAILATLLVGGLYCTAALFRLARHNRRGWVLGGSCALALMLISAYAIGRTEYGAHGLSRATRSLGLRTGYWTATWGIIRDHSLLGTGPGNFGRIYPRYMSQAASEKIQDPHNLFLEVWACSGILALLALVAVIGCFFWKVHQRAGVSVPEPEDNSGPAGRSISWEF